MEVRISRGSGEVLVAVCTQDSGEGRLVYIRRTDVMHSQGVFGMFEGPETDTHRCTPILIVKCGHVLLVLLSNALQRTWNVLADIESVLARKIANSRQMNRWPHLNSLRLKRPGISIFQIDIL